MTTVQFRQPDTSAPLGSGGEFDRPILYFGNDWDAENRTSSHQIALQLRKCSELVYIECPGLRPPAVKRRDVRKIVDKVRKALRKPRKWEGTQIHTLLQIPFHGSSTVRWLNKRIVRFQVARIARRLRNRQPPVLWFAVPHVGYLTEQLSDSSSVYYCVDKFAALPGVDAEAVRRLDAQLTRCADVLFVASETLLADKRQSRPDCILSPHGVDFETFRRALNPELPRPPDLPAWQGPIVGFFGLLESWIDLDLLLYVAQRRPQWLLALIGHEAVDVSRLRGQPNIVLLGRRKFHELPDYGRCFDVCLLPYRLTEQVINSNPIKLREYLAMGKPVVSVRFPHAESFSDLLYLADDYDEFLAQIERALAEDSPERRSSRIESVRASTWQARAQTALSHVAERLRHAG